MNRLTRFSFNLFKISSLGLVLCYLIAVVMVGAAGHSSGDSVSFTVIALYSITLYFSINRYKKVSLLKKSISGFFQSLPGNSGFSNSYTSYHIFDRFTNGFNEVSWGSFINDLNIINIYNISINSNEIYSF